MGLYKAWSVKECVMSRTPLVTKDVAENMIQITTVSQNSPTYYFRRYAATGDGILTSYGQRHVDKKSLADLRQRDEVYPAGSSKRTCRADKKTAREPEAWLKQSKQQERHLAIPGRILVQERYRADPCYGGGAETDELCHQYVDRLWEVMEAMTDRWLRMKIRKTALILTASCGFSSGWL